jgi:hypothetical protein
MRAPLQIRLLLSSKPGPSKRYLPVLLGSKICSLRVFLDEDFRFFQLRLSGGFARLPVPGVGKEPCRCPPICAAGPDASAQGSRKWRKRCVKIVPA